MVLGGEKIGDVGLGAGGRGPAAAWPAGYCGAGSGRDCSAMRVMNLDEFCRS